MSYTDNTYGLTPSIHTLHNPFKPFKLPIPLLDSILKDWGRGKRHLKRKKEDVEIEAFGLKFRQSDVDAIKPQWFWNFNRPPALKLELPFKWKDVNHFEEALRRRGFKVLGSGAFSTVYGKPGSDKVLKVTGRLDGWIDYAHWASQNGYGGTFAPKVFSYKLFTGKPTKNYSYWDKTYQWYVPEFSVAVMERLDKTFSKVDKSEDQKVFEELTRLCVRQNALAGKLLDQAFPGAAKFSMELGKTFEGFDLHGGNYMLRKDGTPVLVDPVTGRKQIKSNRLRMKDFTPSSGVLNGDYYGLYLVGNLCSCYT